MEAHSSSLIDWKLPTSELTLSGVVLELGLGSDEVGTGSLIQYGQRDWSGPFENHNKCAIGLGCQLQRPASERGTPLCSYLSVRGKVLVSLPGVLSPKIPLLVPIQPRLSFPSHAQGKAQCWRKVIAWVPLHHALSPDRRPGIMRRPLKNSIAQLPHVLWACHGICRPSLPLSRVARCWECLGRWRTDFAICHISTSPEDYRQTSSGMLSRDHCCMSQKLEPSLLSLTGPTGLSYHQRHIGCGRRRPE